jgi:hypothetical protein
MQDAPYKRGAQVVFDVLRPTPVPAAGRMFGHYVHSRHSCATQEQLDA